MSPSGEYSRMTSRYTAVTSGRRSGAPATRDGWREGPPSAAQPGHGRTPGSRSHPSS